MGLDFVLLWAMLTFLLNFIPTLGSILGAKLGADNIPETWKAPFNDTLYAEIPGFHPIPISECANRSHAVWQRMRTGG